MDSNELRAWQAGEDPKPRIDDLDDAADYVDRLEYLFGSLEDIKSMHKDRYNGEFAQFEKWLNGEYEKAHSTWTELNRRFNGDE